MNFYRRYSIIFIVVFMATAGSAQDTLNSAIVEQKSYQLYLDKNWPELISFGNKAIHKGFDYFYLELRVGIAYYEKKNYSMAQGYFKKALSYNSDDELTLEYLYYCYVFNGRSDDARLLSKKFNAALSQKTGVNKQYSVSLIFIEAGTKKTDSAGYYNAMRKDKPFFFNPAVYFQLGLNHYVKNRVSIFHALTYFNQETFLSRVAQVQYYLKSSVPIKNNWSIAPAVHWINLKTEMEVLQQPPPKVTFPPYTVVNQQPIIKTVTTISNYFAGSLYVQKIIKKFTFGIGTTASNMNNIMQYIHTGFVSYALLGNSKLVIGCTGYLHTSDSYSTTNNSIAPFLYMQPFKKLSLKLSYLENTTNNIIEDNGYLINNSSDLTKSRYSAMLNFTVGKYFGIYGLYQLENKEEMVQKFNYRYNVFVAGIRITP